MSCLVQVNPDLTEDQARALLSEENQRPCSIVCLDKALEQSVGNASRNLIHDKFHHDSDVKSVLQPVRSFFPKGSLGKATQSISKLMLRLNHRLHHGSIYSKVPEGIFNKSVYLFSILMGILFLNSHIFNIDSEKL